MKANRLNSKTILLALVLISALLSFKGEKDSLHKRVFNISLGDLVMDFLGDGAWCPIKSEGDLLS